MNHLARHEAPQPLGARAPGDFGGIQDDLRQAGHLQHVTRFKVDEPQDCVGVEHEVAPRIEEEVAVELGQREAAIGVDAHEAGLAAGVDVADTALPRLRMGLRPFQQAANVYGRSSA